VRDAYLKIAAAEPQRVRVVNAGVSVQETQHQVMEIVLPFLESNFQSSQPSEP
jgi:thymidylate kinase